MSGSSYRNTAIRVEWRLQKKRRFRHPIKQEPIEMEQGCSVESQLRRATKVEVVTVSKQLGMLEGTVFEINSCAELKVQKTN